MRDIGCWYMLTRPIFAHTHFTSGTSKNFGTGTRTVLLLWNTVDANEGGTIFRWNRLSNELRWCDWKKERKNDKDQCCALSSHQGAHFCFVLFFSLNVYGWELEELEIG